MSTWIDNMGIGFMNLEGKWDPATKSINCTGMNVDPSTGKDMNVKETFSMVDSNTQKNGNVYGKRRAGV